MPVDPRHDFGKTGEDLACEELCRRGYEILARRYRTRLGEIDIIARHAGALVFVEVKARHGRAFGGGAAAVGTWKRKRIVRMATDYLMRRRLLGQPCRFDVVAVDFEDGRFRVEVYTHAFGLTA
jgi:putative endonuclease